MGSSGLPPEHVELAQRLIGKMLQSPQIQTLIKMLGVDRLDVMGEALAYVIRKWPMYNPVHKGKKISPATFIQRYANSGIYDYLRAEGRRQRREMPDGQFRDKQQEEFDWLRNVYQAAKSVCVDQRHARGKRFPAPPLLALAALMQQREMSSRDCVRLLASRDDLRAAIRLKRVPSYSTLLRARAMISQDGHDGHDSPDGDRPHDDSGAAATHQQSDKRPPLLPPGPRRDFAPAKPRIRADFAPAEKIFPNFPPAPSRAPVAA